MYKKYKGAMRVDICDSKKICLVRLQLESNVTWHLKSQTFASAAWNSKITIGKSQYYKHLPAT